MMAAIKGAGLRKSVAALYALTLLLLAYAAPLHHHTDSGLSAAAQSVICHDAGADPGAPQSDARCCDLCTLAVSPGLALAWLVTLVDWPAAASRADFRPDDTPPPRIILQAARSRAPPMPLV